MNLFRNGKPPEPIPPTSAASPALSPRPLTRPTNAVACPGAHYEAGTYDRPDMLIDQPLANAILLHLARHLVPSLRALRPARAFFAIGPGGNGKSEHALAVPSRYGVDALMIAGADLCPGPLHGQSIAVLNNCIDYITYASLLSGRPFVFIIDDIDGSILPEKPGVEQTDDTANTLGKLQALCNGPDAFTTGNGTSVPMIYTGNNSLFLRTTLIRPGRCTFYHHTPDWQAKARAVEHVFKPATNHDRKRLRKLVWHYRHQPISFFTDLRTELADAQIISAIQAHGLDVRALENVASRDRSLNFNALDTAAARRDQHRGGDLNE